MSEDERFIENTIRDHLYNYKYLLKEYDYNVFVEAVVSEIIKELKDD